ncbi:spherulation-specific family 4 protein, partial [Streptomyces sp. NPDC047023]|uniref:spherulation-specific family 4 protein n=1 Tax=Streptomyces sp. NPDC047023 TaxID=3155139 RepID=UPI003401AD67
MTHEKKDPMLLVPLYEHPADRPEAWERLIRSADRLHSVVLNPGNGPGSAPDERFAHVAERLRDAGVPVLGYADTDYGRRPHAAGGGGGPPPPRVKGSQRAVGHRGTAEHRHLQHKSGGAVA